MSAYVLKVVGMSAYVLYDISVSGRNHGKTKAP